MYPRFALTDPLFYDDPTLRPALRARPLHPDPDLDWSSWERSDDGRWIGWAPHGATLPEQGWKIHVSATAAGAEEVLLLVSGWCHRTRTVFKHVPDLDELDARNAKEADRAAAGKSITLYPTSTEHLHRALLDLDALVGGRPGPYVLSDLRWHEGPLHVRYGAFRQAWTRRDDGEEVLALRSPAGDLVEDRRTAAFTPPDWVDVPAFLRAQVDALHDTTTPEGFGYTVTGALHHSNAGGVYDARTADGERVVLKEARPHAGTTPDGRDAVARLHDEERHLRLLAGADLPAVRDAFTVHSHRFLVLEHVPGVGLHTAVVARSPAIRADAGPDDRLAYRGWALDVAAQVTATVERLHAAGYVHGDLHPRNVMVTPDDRAVLIDLEMTHPVRERRPVVIGAPGFVPPDRRSGVAADRYALACLVLFLFCPLTPLLALDPLKADELLEAAQDAFALDHALIARLRRDLALPGRERLLTRSRLVRAADSAVRRWDTGSEDAVLALQVMIARSLDAAADHARTDRLWPGDPRQLTEDPAALAHGATGVVHALDASSLDVSPQTHDWLAEATERALTSPTTRPGLLDGLAGIGWAARRRGDDATADRVLDRLRGLDTARLDSARLDPARLGSDLHGGLPGIGLHLLAEAERDPDLLVTVDRWTGLLRHRLDALPRTSRLRTGHGGLLRGPTGTALLALRLHQRTGEAAHLRLALDALDRDLAHCTDAEDGSLQVDEGWRLMPYLGTGSAGIGLVLAQVLPHLPDPTAYRAVLDRITRAARAPFVVEPGLLQGRAGLVHHLVALTRLGLATPDDEAALAAHVDALRLHAVRHRTGIAFPGQGLLRLSCDLATGSAGVLTALQAWTMLAHDEERPGWDTLLPYWLPTPARRPAPAGPGDPGRR
jgi:serine/threonine protein kinase